MGTSHNIYILQHILQVHDMAEEVSCSILTVEAKLQYRASPYGNCGSWNGTETVFMQGNLSFWPVTVIPLVLHAHLCIAHYILSAADIYIK